MREDIGTILKAFVEWQFNGQNFVISNIVDLIFDSLMSTTILSTTIMKLLFHFK